MDITRFEDMRPYYDEEVPAAMQRIAAHPSFPVLSSFLYPDRPVEEVRKLFTSFRNISDFQLNAMKAFNEQVISQTITEFTYSGVEKIDPSKRYLYVSNHRDIVLDSSLMQYVLYLNGHDTTEITFGANLMQGQLLIDFGKSNKMFRVERAGVTPRDFYNSSLLLSDYLRYTLLDKRQSVWIAQRNGRTKDGIDRTDQGIVKMFGMSRTDDRVASLAELNIMPVSVSYEWEPCDVLKALELYVTNSGGTYIKKPGEDLNSILTGLTQPKGRMHIHFCDPVTEEDLRAFDDVPNVQFHRKVANLLDRRICSAFRLFPNNYIAHDLRYGHRAYTDRYTDEQMVAFDDRLESLNKYQDADPEILKDIFLSIYANPIAVPVE
jgi:hypothetical protein